MKIRYRELFLFVIFACGSFCFDTQAQTEEELGRFDYRNSSESPEAARVKKAQFYDLIVEEYEAIRVARNELKEKLKNTSDDGSKKKIQNKIDALDKKEKAVDDKMKNPPK